MEHPIQWLNWKTETTVWVDQWPLSKDKLSVLNVLMDEQLKKGNTETSNSPWNSPLFVSKKVGKNRWHLLLDLWKINDIIEDMGPLQARMPSPFMLPRNWKLAVIDIKDCFFQIPLDPHDAPWFLSSLHPPRSSHAALSLASLATRYERQPDNLPVVHRTRAVPYPKACSQSDNYALYG